MAEQSKAEELLRRTFGYTTAMQPDERVNQSNRPWTTEELNAAGIPVNLHSQATWWSTLQEMKQDLNL